MDIPPGILSFKLKNGCVVRCPQGEISYNNAVAARLINGDYINSITVEGREWTLNDVMEDKEFGDMIISHFEYTENRWRGCSGYSWYDLEHLTRQLK